MGFSFGRGSSPATQIRTFILDKALFHDQLRLIDYPSKSPIPPEIWYHPDQIESGTRHKLQINRWKFPVILG